MCFSFLIDVFKQWLRLPDCILCQLHFIFSLTYPDSTYTLISDQPMTFHRICCDKANGDVPTFFLVLVNAEYIGLFRNGRAFSCLKLCRIQMVELIYCEVALSGYMPLLQMRLSQFFSFQLRMKS